MSTTSIRLFSIAAYPALSVAGQQAIPELPWGEDGVRPEQVASSVQTRSGQANKHTHIHPSAQPGAAAWADFTQEHFCHWSKPCTATVNIHSGLVLMAPSLKCFLDKRHAMSHREHNAETPHFEHKSESEAKQRTPESCFRTQTEQTEGGGGGDGGKASEGAAQWGSSVCSIDLTMLL